MGEPGAAVELRDACARVTAFRDCFRGGSVELLPVPDPQGKGAARLFITWAPDSLAFPARLFRWDEPSSPRTERCVSPPIPAGDMGLEGPAAAGRMLGSGDIDGDDVADIAILMGPDASNPREVRIVRGGQGPAIRILLPCTGTLDEASAAFVGDLDGDGAVDLGISWWQGEDRVPRLAGIHILLSRPLSGLRGPIRLEEIATAGFGAHLSFAQGAVRLSFAGCGDLDGDGFGDLAVASSRMATIVRGCSFWPEEQIILPADAPCGTVSSVILYDRRLLDPPHLLCSRQGDSTGLLIAFPARTADRGRSGAILAVTADEVLDPPAGGFIEARERFTDGRNGWTIGESLSPAGDFDGDGFQDILTACSDPDGDIEWCLLFGGEGFFERPSEKVGIGRVEEVLLAGPPSKSLQIRVPAGAPIDGDGYSDLILPFEEAGRLGAFLVSGGSRRIEAGGTGARFRRGDASQDGAWDLGDAIVILAHLFAGTTPPDCLDAADSDDDGHLTLADALLILDFLFRGSAPFPAPLTCGPDCTAAGLGCDRYVPCAP